MRELKGLIYIDFSTTGKKNILIFSGLFVGAFILSLFTLPHIPGALVMFVFFMLQPTFTIGEKSGYNKLYGMLPVKKTQIVVAKYISVLIVTALTALACSVLGGVSSAVTVLRSFFAESDVYGAIGMLYEIGLTPAVYAAMMFVAGCFFAAMEFSVLFIFGPAKEMSVGIVVLTIVIGILFAVKQIFNITLESSARWLAYTLMDNKALFMVCCYGIGVLLLAVGAAISAFFYNKKEL